MVKLGVVDRQGLRRPVTLLGRRRHVSYLLLRELARARDVNPAEYDQIAGFAPMPNGVWKLTHRGRMRLLDQVVVDLARRRVDRHTRLVVADVAASSGVTSVEFFDALQKYFTVDFFASDLFRDLFAVCHRQWPIAAVFDPGGNPVQYVCGRLVIPACLHESSVYPANRAAKILLERWFLPVAKTSLRAADLDALDAFDTCRVGEHEVTRLSMLSRDTLEAVQANEGFQFQVWNILEPLPIRAHFVRAMNILTNGHFTADLRLRALKNCIDAVLPNGFFIAGRSPSRDPTEVMASVYLVSDGSLTELVRLNGGSEIDSLIAASFHVRSSAQA